MSQNNIVVTQLAQLGFADRIVQETQGNAEAARQAAQQAAPEALKQQKEAVAGTEDTEKSRKLKSEKDGGGGKSDFPGNRRHGKGGAPPEEQESAPENPWAGNILNLKV